MEGLAVDLLSFGAAGEQRFRRLVLQRRQALFAIRLADQLVDLPAHLVEVTPLLTALQPFLAFVGRLDLEIMFALTSFVVHVERRVGLRGLGWLRLLERVLLLRWQGRGVLLRIGCEPLDLLEVFAVQNFRLLPLWTQRLFCVRELPRA